MTMIIALLIVICLLFIIVFILWFITFQIRTFAGACADVLEGRESIRENTRRIAEERLREAYRDYYDPKFKEIDYNLGDGRGYRRPNACQRKDLGRNRGDRDW